ncbi:hypothetical protein FA95DRAFT_1613473 [Auriscalpium vulgare]|uniref:Uncharacterized protein n=1 Tax=Auriscalpium vulgare TaxID=40419 RepID=A0ACB8R461_9AGAM|nr:hypothetical protein FA95DRAFT_1613473 [Auriscalpium vulgare]
MPNLYYVLDPGLNPGVYDHWPTVQNLIARSKVYKYRVYENVQHACCAWVLDRFPEVRARPSASLWASAVEQSVLYSVSGRMSMPNPGDSAEVPLAANEQADIPLVTALDSPPSADDAVDRPLGSHIPYAEQRPTGIPTPCASPSPKFRTLAVHASRAGSPPNTAGTPTPRSPVQPRLKAIAVQEVSPAGSPPAHSPAVPRRGHWRRGRTPLSIAAGKGHKTAIFRKVPRGKLLAAVGCAPTVRRSYRLSQ